jgi:Na+/melibiose symporter-like transporter
MFLKDKNGNRFFTKRIPMLPVTAVWEIIYAIFWGVRSLSEKEISNECNDYIEWKCGYRNEATLSIASAFICKIPARINNILQPRYKQWVGYDQTAYTEGRQQPLHAQKWIFAMATLFPAIIVLTSMIPMFWFNIDKTTRDKMYRELNERRVAVAEMIKREADAEETENA